MMNKLIFILKAFVVIALIPILLIVSVAYGAVTAPYVFEDISHPLFAFIAMILMLPMGALFMAIFFVGVGFPPTVVITPMGRGGYGISSGQSRGGGLALILNIVRLVLTIPIALLIWITVSIVVLFSKKLENKINNIYEKLVKSIKSWYRFAIILFVIFPCTVFGFNALENAIYSPKNIIIEVTNYSYTGVMDDCAVFEVSFSIENTGKEISDFSGYWEVVDKKTNNSVKFDEGKITPYNWRWSGKEQDQSYDFTTSLMVPLTNTKELEIMEQEIEDLTFNCRVKKIWFPTRFFLFRDIWNEYEDGYIIEATTN